MSRSAALRVLPLLALLALQVVDGRECEKPCQIQICSCSTPDVMDCSNRQLKQFPAGTTYNATGVRVLKLNNNYLNAIPDLSRFTDLHTLDLSHNKISAIVPFSFISLPQLLHLNISFNDILLSNSTVSMESFSGLDSLKTLRMKQNRKPVPNFNYEALKLLNNTLEELYLSGTPMFSPVFQEFKKLNTLSLGGSACHTPYLTDQSMRSITRLPLKRFSARHCGIKEINREFLQSFKETLLKLDLSCNHLKDYFHEIAFGIENSKLEVLMLDHINYRPDGGADECWWIFSDDDIKPLNSTPLKIISMQANQIQTPTNLKFREYCAGLLYLDVSQNEFNKSAFRVVPEVGGQSLPRSAMALFYNVDLQSPSLKYLGLQGLTKPYSCGEEGYNKGLLSCDEDSYLFTEDKYYWDHSNDPDIMDIHTLFKVRQNIVDICGGFSFFKCETVDSMISAITQYVRQNRFDYVSNNAINKTVHYMIKEVGISAILGLEGYEIRFVPANVTTFAFSYNDFSFSDEINESPICSNLRLYPNNAESFDFSHSTVGFIPCKNVSGLKYSSKLTCKYCGISGWFPDFFADFPVNYLDLTGNRLGERLRDDMTGNAFGSAPGLERLYIGEQEGGIKYFNNPDILTYHPNLTYLDLHDNELTSWNITISNNPQLTYIDLRDNKISYIEEKYRNEFDNQSELREFTVDLAGNKVLCTDSHSDYIYWLLTSSSVACTNTLLCAGSELTVSDYYNFSMETTTPFINNKGAEETAAIVVASVITLGIIIMLAIVYINRYTLMLRCYQQKNKSFNNEERVRQKLYVFTSHTPDFTDKLVGLMNEIADDSIIITSREISLVPGYMLRASTAKLIAQSDRVVIFITPDYLKEDMTKFEFELIKMKKSDDMQVVTVGIDSASQMEHLPQILKDIISARNHLTWPLGLCSGTSSNVKAFVETLKLRLNTDQSATSI